MQKSGKMSKNVFKMIILIIYDNTVIYFKNQMVVVYFERNLQHYFFALKQHI